MSLDLAIDRAPNVVRVWNGGRAKLWMVVDESGSIDRVGLEQQEILSLGQSIQRLRLRQPIAAALRFWRHRTPRPDSVGLQLALLPRGDQNVALRAPATVEAPHKPVFRSLCSGAQRALEDVASVPFGGLEICVLRLQDDGPSSAEGMALAIEHGLAALVLAAYRRGLVPYL
jgi:hypothetical protein